MEDFYDDPSFEVEEDFDDSDLEGNPLEAIKDYIPMIAVGLIVLFIGFLAFSFLVGMNIDVRISVKNLDERLISESSITIADSAGNPIITERDSSSYVFTLRPGTYFIKVRASGYKDASREIVVEEDSINEVVRLEKDVDISLSADFPEEIISGKETIVPITLRNFSQRDAIIQLETEGLKGLLAEIGGGILVQAESEKIFNMKITPREKNQEEERTAKIKIKLTKIEETVSFKIVPPPEFEVPRRISFSSMSSSPSSEKNSQEEEIEIRNNGNVPVQNITLSFEITKTEENSKEDVLSWFSFPSGTFASVIEPDSSEIFILRADIPVEAKKDSIDARIIVSSSSIDEEKEITVELNVTEEAMSQINVEMDETFNVSYSEEEEKFEQKEKVISIENSGNVDVRNIIFLIENKTTCNLNWFEFSESDFINRIEAGKTKDILFIVSAPESAKGSEQAMNCTISWKYRHPLTQELIEGTKTIAIIPS